RVEAGSAADKAGIRAGDVIVAIDGERIKRSHDLPIRVARHRPGDRVRIDVVRGGKPKTIVVTVEKMPEEAVARRGAGQRLKLGVLLGELDEETARSLGVRVRYGLVVRQVVPGSPAARAGIAKGDVIYRVDGRAMRSLEDFRKLARGFKPGQVLRVMLDRHGDQVFTLVRLPEARRGE
ncbi:MAG: PDZ domain-containing protein, partial [Mariprofundaceae bacterium]